MNNFGANFLSAFVIGIIFTLLIPFYLDYRNKPIIKFKFRIDKEDNKIIKVTNDGKFEGSIELIIKNEGKKVLRDYYWSLLIPSNLNPKISEHQQITEPKIEKLNDKWVRLSGIINSPLYPNSNYLLPYEIKIQTSILGEFYMYYNFNTEFGPYPPESKIEVKNIEESIEKNYLGKLTFFLKSE